MHGRLRYVLTKNLTDEGEVIETTQQNQFVGLTAFIPERDKTVPDPKIYVEQSMIRDGQEEILIHELTFGGQVQTGIDYIFRGIGDEHPDFGKRDLKVRLLSVSVHISLPFILRANFGSVGDGRERRGINITCFEGK
jgi:hypothetical protein